MSICLKDIYTGRPDACDEIAEDGIKKFTESFILPPSFDLQSFLGHGWCYVTGYKGTGKSALLWYIKHKVETDQKAITGFIIFKNAYTEIKRRQMSQQAQKLSTDIIIPPFCSDNVPVRG